MWGRKVPALAFRRRLLTMIGWVALWGVALLTILRISKLYWKVFVRRPPPVISALRSKASSEETIAEAFASENVTTSVQPRRVT
jgi:hypothetical protein